jgi:deoxyribodipyrimidine photo-lyase
VPVFCFDPRLYSNENEKYSTRKAGIVRTQFHLETVEVLRQSLQEIGSELLVFFDKPENALVKLVEKDRYTTIVYSNQICPNEVVIERNVRANIY